MPEMDGFTLAERIKDRPELAGSVLMMLSSAGRPGDSAHCRELGLSAYLTKPFKQSELLDMILTTLDGQASGPSGAGGGAAPRHPARPGCATEPAAAAAFCWRKTTPSTSAWPCGFWKSRAISHRRRQRAGRPSPPGRQARGGRRRST